MAVPHNKGKGEGIAFLRAHVGYQGDDCLIWPFCRIRGYGIVNFDGQRNIRAHRVMCELVRGPAPSDVHEAAHSCGNGHGGCINPRHLSWKTPVENQADRKAHGRAGRGPAGWRREKLTPEQVAEIRALKGKKSQDAIAAMFGCTRENIGRIHRGVSWKAAA
jgi:hypothetical protein